MINLNYLKILLILKKIFIVHGQDHKLRDKITKIVESLDMIPYVLEKDTKAGSTIIIQEIFKNLNDSLGVIIIAKADEAKIEWKNLDTPKLTFKARDNVLIEIGICFSLLKPENIIFLWDTKLDTPSDLNGIRYISTQDKKLKKTIVERLKNMRDNSKI